MSYNSASYPLVTDFDSILAKETFATMATLIPAKTDPRDVMIFTAGGDDDLIVRVDVKNIDSVVKVCSSMLELNRVFQYAQWYLSSYTFALTEKTSPINGINFEGKY